MTKERTVVVKGGGKNLYKISEFDGWFHAYKVDVRMLASDKHSIGKARSLSDALELIRSHSGQDISQIS